MQVGREMTALDLARFHCAPQQTLLLGACSFDPPRQRPRQRDLHEEQQREATDQRGEHTGERAPRRTVD